MPERKLAPEPTRAISVKRDAEGDSEGSKLVDLHLEAICTAHEGVRNDTLNARAFFIGKLVAAGAASEEEAMQAVLEAAAEAQIDGAAYTAKRSIREGIQAGPYRIPEPSPHFPLVEPLPPVEARAELGNAILDIVNQAENWKFLKSEIQTAVDAGETARSARHRILERYRFKNLTHAPRDMIRATPGLGKTRQTIATILESALELALFFVPTTQLAEELAADYHGQVKAIKGRCESNCSQYTACQFAGKRGIPVYRTFCKLDLDDRLSVKCIDFYKCSYLKQFKPTGEKIIALSHEYLKLDFPLLRQLGMPDLHIIDENIVSLVAGKISFQPSMLPVDFRDLQPGDDALKRAIERGWTLDDVRAYRAECYLQMQTEALAGARGLHPGIDPALALAKMTSVTNTGATQRWRFFSTLAAQWKLGKGAEAIRIETKSVDVDGIEEQQVRVFVNFKRELSGLREGEPVLLLDADGDIDINRAIVSTRMQEHRIEAARNVRVIQVAVSCSKTALGVLPDKVASNKLTRMAQAIRGIPGKKMLCTYLNAKPLADFGLDDEGITHFGGFLGKNDWENHDIAVILGRNLVPCNAIEDLSRAIYLNSPEPLNLPGRYEMQSQGYLMRDESHRGARVQAHPDPRVNAILDIQRGQLSAQAADRLRLVNDDDRPKTVIIMDNTPTPLPVDTLLTETGFITLLAVGKLVSDGGGFAVVNQANMGCVGVSAKEAEKIIKSIASKSPQLPPSIYNSIYGGEAVDFYNLAFQNVSVSGGSVVVASTLGPEETARRINRHFNLEPIQEALARCSTGVIPLSKRWLNENFPELFTSESVAQRAIAAIKPTGFCRFQGSKRMTAFLAADDCAEPRAALEELAEAPLVAYEGPERAPPPTPAVVIPSRAPPPLPPLEPANDDEVALYLRI